MRSLASDFCELLSMTLEPCEVGFHPLPAATHGGQQRASRTEQNRPRLAPIIDGVFGYGHLDLHALYLNLLAPHLAPHFNDATRSLRAAVWRAGSVAARWEYRSTPLVRREKARACATPHPCTHPSLCLPPSQVSLHCSIAPTQCGSFRALLCIPHRPSPLTYWVAAWGGFTRCAVAPQGSNSGRFRLIPPAPAA